TNEQQSPFGRRIRAIHLLESRDFLLQFGKIVPGFGGACLVRGREREEDNQGQQNGATFLHKRNTLLDQSSRRCKADERHKPVRPANGGFWQVSHKKWPPFGK